MVRAAPVPEHALHARYAREGSSVDCYATTLAAAIGFEQYVAAFYTTWLFRLERAILARLAGRPSTDSQALALARGERDTFAAWSVEARAPAQLLMRDMHGATCSWFMVESCDGGAATRLYFGSVVVARARAPSQRPRIGRAYRAVMGVHALYSRALLHAARAKLARAPGGTPPAR